MKIRFFTVILTTVFALGLALTTSADGVTKRVKFAKGKSSATLSGAVIRGDRDTYILGAKSEQMMSVKITSTEKNAVFQITDPSGEFLQDAGEMDDAMNWTGALPYDGDYRIIVGGTRGNATYKLTVSIK